MTDFVEHMKRHIAFSRATFGPGQRREGVIDHIRKELVELTFNPDDNNAVNEWVDVVILALDGLWREVNRQAEFQCPAGIHPTTDHVADAVVRHILRKQNKNEHRTWPDWRQFGENEAIEHDRTKDNS